MADRPAGPEVSWGRKMHDRSKAREGLIQSFADFLIVGGLIAATVAPLVLLIEVVEWLTRSEWPGLTLADGLGLFGIVHETAETEAQRFVDVMMALPLTISLFFLGLSMFFGGLNLGEWSIDRERARTGGE